LILFFIIFINALSCRRATTMANKSEVPIVFVHGGYAAYLDDDRGHRGWMNTTIGLGLESPDISLPFTFDENGKQGASRYKPTTIIEQLGVCCLKQTVYGPFVAHMNSLNRPFYKFVYDWRRDLTEAVDAFEKYVQGINEKHNNVGVQLITHSLGSYVGFSLVNRRPELFYSALFAGGPFGAEKPPSEIHTGYKAGLNTRIRNTKAMISFVSLLSFSSFEGKGLVDTKNQPIAMDWYSMSDWKKAKFSIYAYDDLPEGFDEYFARTLENTKKFKLSLAFRSDITYPPVGIINSKSHPCNGRIMKDGPASVRGYDITSAPSVLGDTRVWYEDSHPPKGVPYTEYTSINKHDDLLSDANIVTKAIDELFAQREKKK